MDSVSCSICFDKMKKNNLELVCKHKYHQKCILKWAETHKTCPMCRMEIYIINCCYICLDIIAAKDDKHLLITLTCGHVFHQRCYNNKLTSSCPTCFRMQPDNLIKQKLFLLNSCFQLNLKYSDLLEYINFDDHRYKLIHQFTGRGLHISIVDLKHNYIVKCNTLNNNHCFFDKLICWFQCKILH